MILQMKRLKMLIPLLASLSLFAVEGKAAPMTCDTVLKAPSRAAKERKPRMDTLKIAAVQFPLAEAASEADFFTKVDGYITQAQNAGSQLVVFPELVTTELVDWTKAEIPQLQQIAKDFTPRYIQWLQDKARNSGMYILGGTTPRVTDKGIVNTALLAYPDGSIKMQDKIFLTPDEKEWGWTPGTTLNVFDTPWGKTVIAICFDCEFPVISQTLAAYKPDLILVPSWTSTASGLNRVDWTSKARAIEHYAYVVKTGTVPAPNSTQPHFGQATIVSPQEPAFPVDVITGKLNADQIIYGQVDFALQKQMKARSGYYPGHEQAIRDPQFPINMMEEE